MRRGGADGLQAGSQKVTFIHAISESVLMSIYHSSTLRKAMCAHDR
jgi:hypothetical protein